MAIVTPGLISTRLGQLRRPVWFGVGHLARLLLVVVLTLLLTQHDVRFETLSHFKPATTDAHMRLQSKPQYTVQLSGALLLESADQKAHRGLIWTYPVPPEAQAVRVQGRVEIRHVTQGEKHWERASVALRQIDAQKKPRERSVFGETGTRSETLDEVQQLNPDTTSVQLLVRLLRASGSMRVQDLSLSFVAERPSVQWAIKGLWLVWTWALASLVWAWLRGARQPWSLVTGAVLVLSAVTLPGAWRDALAQWLITGLGLPASQVLSPQVDVYVHSLMFWLLAVLLGLNRPDWPLWRCAGELVALAACTEVVQLLVPGRSAEWFDWGVDTACLTLGLLMVAVWRYRAGRSGAARSPH
ncbi:MAG: hypothetical protein RLZZ352_1489 [Pseudomonadota bacterium]|jgi:hypothetical protein